jgi:hypothetical protein
MIVCPRCKTENSAWERRCKACWQRFEAALRTQSEPSTQAAVNEPDASAAGERRLLVEKPLVAAPLVEKPLVAATLVGKPLVAAPLAEKPLVAAPLAEEVTAAEAHELRSAPDDDAQQRTLAQLLGIEVAHVRALADNGIHTLEHIAESMPEQIGRALRAWTHIDPAAVIAQARRLLDLEPAPTPAPGEPDPAGWWKMR